jgi:hypothetical protein
MPQKRKSQKLEDLNRTQTAELREKWEVANNIELYKSAKLSRSLRRRHERTQKMIHDRQSWRAYTI